MSTQKRDLLLEIGCEELPATFVETALEALPGLAKKKLGDLRLGFGEMHAYGTPRRLAILVTGVDQDQTDLDEEVLGPPTRAAFKDGAPTRAAEAFAEKLGVKLTDLAKKDTPKGEYLVGTRKEKGRPASELLGAALLQMIKEIPFRKSMRWADFDFAFGRPIQWIVSLFGSEVIPLEIASVKSGRTSRGHRFVVPAGVKERGPVAVEIEEPRQYLEKLRHAHVFADTQERRDALDKALKAAAKEANGVLIEDDFLMGENLTLVEEPFVVVGSFDPAFLELPERVIMEIAKGHQRDFCIRDEKGALLPKYLTVVNTALDRKSIQRGNDNVMRARLSDGRFFFKTDLAVPLADRREKLGGVVFQKRLGSVLEKANRVEKLAKEIGESLSLPAATIEAATKGAHLSKCDLVSLMVGEFPELQGEMGEAYAKAQGVDHAAAKVIAEHYKPKGANDSTAGDDASALVAIADRLDTLVACFAIGLVPTGTADPFGLRRACLGILRTIIDRSFDLSVSELVKKAYQGLTGIKLDLDEAVAVTKVSEFATERLKGFLSDRYAADVVRASIAASSDRPLDVLARVTALLELDASTRAQVGEVFKRASNIAKEAPAGEPQPPRSGGDPIEGEVFEKLGQFHASKDRTATAYGEVLRQVASLAPLLARYFEKVMVMCDDKELRENRLRLMRVISERGASVARLELLAV